MSSDLRLGMVLDGLYRLDRLLGVGGVGAVYAAEHLNLSRAVAIKVLHPQFAQSQEPLQRFHREAQLLSNLGHPSFVGVYDFGYAPDGTAYLVMEMVEGETMRKRVDQGPLPIGEVLGLFGPLCEALEQAHRLQIIHRDLKPDNLMMLPGGGVKILDFGMAKLLSDEVPLTADKVVMGTPYYMAPERARGQRAVDGGSDIFSLGAILYEGLTGKMAFGAESPVAAMYRVIQAPVPPLGLADRALSARLDDVIATACAKDPRDRYPSALEMWAGLEEAVKTDRQRAPQKDPAEAELAARKTKAGLVQATIAYVRERYGEAGFQRLCQRFGPERVERIMSSLPTSWVENGELHDLHGVMLDLFDDGSFEMMRDVGRFFADIALSTTYKSFLNAGGPLTLVRRAQMMYNTMSSNGELRVAQISAERFRIQMRDVPTLSAALMAATAGWARRYLELAGAVDIQFFGETIRYEDGKPIGETEFTFTVPA